MIPLTTREVADAVGGRVVGPPVTVEHVGADSRTTGPGALFVALPPRVDGDEGQRDGHDFVDRAVEQGAAAVLVQREGAMAPGVSGVVVDDTWEALGRLASHVREVVGPRVVALTGSVGKTTTKDLIASACGQQRRTVAARGSFNNELGVPLTLLSIEHDTELVVVEIGARGVGHIASLVGWVRPDVAVVTAVAGAHLEQFGDLETVALAKGELVEALADDGVAVLNLDDPRVVAMGRRTAGAVVTWSASGSSDATLRARDVVLDDQARPSFTAVTPWGDVHVHVPLAGRHHVGNALAALAVAGQLGLDVAVAAAGIGAAAVSHWRSEVTDVGGVLVLNDAYNANPTSTVAALEALAAMAATGRRWAVLGVMAELGPDHDAGHARVGDRAAQLADVVVVVGPLASGIVEAARLVVPGERPPSDVRHVDDVEAAIALLGEVAPGDAVLIKASRSAGFERISEALLSRLAGPAATAGTEGYANEESAA